MKVFDIKNPLKWQKAPANTPILFACPNSTRKVHLRINADWPVRVYISDTESMAVKTLAAMSDGLFEVTATISADAYISFEFPEKEAECFVQQMIGNQVLDPTFGEKYTSLEPRRRRNSDLDRVMHFARINEARRDAQYKEEISKMEARLRAKQEEQKVLDGDDNGDETPPKAKKPEPQEPADKGEKEPKPDGEKA